MFKKTIYLGLTAIALSGCTSVLKSEVTTHGYLPIEEKIQYVGSQSMTQRKVASVFGEPFIIGVYDSSFWYYMQYRMEQYGFGKQKIVSFNLLELEFDDGYLKSINKFSKEDLKTISPTNKDTKTYGKEAGLIEEIVRNIGRFRTKPETTF